MKAQTETRKANRRKRRTIGKNRRMRKSRENPSGAGCGFASLRWGQPYWRLEWNGSLTLDSLRFRSSGRSPSAVLRCLGFRAALGGCARHPAPAGDRQPSGLYDLLRNMGGRIGIAAANTITQRHLQTHRNDGSVVVRVEPRVAPRPRSLDATHAPARWASAGPHAVRIAECGPDVPWLRFVPARHAVGDGRAAGDEQDLQGHPFVGPGGNLLRRALAETGIDSAHVYIPSAVKHFSLRSAENVGLTRSRALPRPRPVSPGLRTN